MAVINVRTLEVGAKVRLTADCTAEVIDNPGDGMWVMVRYLTCPDDPSQEGNEEMAFATDVIDEL
jgi:hypothetical protein